MRGANLDRIEQVIALRKRGLTYDAIGKSLTPPVCRERIRQMLVMWNVSLTGQLPRKPKPPKPPNLCRVCKVEIGKRSKVCRKHCNLPEYETAEALINFVETVRTSRKAGMTWAKIGRMMGSTKASEGGFMTKYKKRLQTARKHGFVQD